MRRSAMATLIVSYSLTGNNQALAKGLATSLSAQHIRITEPKKRTTGTIALDVMLNRTPKIEPLQDRFGEYDVVMFVGPVWMGQVAAPFRACFKQYGAKIDKYAYISISGGAEGPNPKLKDELTKRLGKAPVAVVDLHIADLLPKEPKPERKDTSAYKINEKEVGQLTESVVTSLKGSNLPI